MTEDLNGFEAKIFREGEATLIEMRGTIDENAEFTDVEAGESKKLIIDLEKVVRINSVGIRSWIIWFNKNARAKDLFFRACPKVVVDQFNFVDDFLPRGATIESFYLPYYCEDCDVEEKALLKAGVDFKAATSDVPEKVQAAAKLNCPECGKPMDPDVSEKTYFKFLRIRP